MRSGHDIAGHAYTQDQLLAYTSENPFDRFADGRPKVPEALMERAKDLSAEEILAVLPGQGYRNQYADGFEVLRVPGAAATDRRTRITSSTA